MTSVKLADRFVGSCYLAGSQDPEIASYPSSNCWQALIKMTHKLFLFATADESDLSTSKRSIGNNPALQRWVGKLSRLSPLRTA